ncbi:MAG: DMT family transporter [Firmicutes bacterium]|nr:DMT family transporter [Bacillota bacterium]
MPGFLWAILSALAFSTEGLLARAAAAGGGAVPPVLLLRYAVAVLALRAAERLGAGGREEAAPAPRSLRLELVLSGVVGYAGTTLLLFASFARLPTSLAILLLYTYPVWVSLGAHWLGEERLTRRRVAALAVALAGTFLVAGASWAGGREWSAGVLLALAAALSNTVQMLLVHRVIAAGTPPERAARLSVSWGLLALLAVAAWTGAALPGSGSMAWSWLRGGPGGWSAGAWWASLALGLVPTFVAILALARSLERIGPARTAILATSEPVFALLWGVLLLGERLAPSQLLGALVLLAGLVWLVHGEPEASEAGDRAPRRAGSAAR